jgi:hypothetical protein
MFGITHKKPLKVNKIKCLAKGVVLFDHIIIRQKRVTIFGGIRLAFNHKARFSFYGFSIKQ